jgi:hypothetical protein
MGKAQIILVGKLLKSCHFKTEERRVTLRCGLGEDVGRWIEKV